MNTNPILNSPIMGYARHRIILDADNKPCDYEFLEVNTTFEKLTGLRVSDVVGRRVREVIPGIEDAEFDWVAFFGDIALNGGDKEFEQYSEPLGRWYRVHVYSDEPLTFTTIFIDITESKKQAEELIASQERYRAMFEVSSDAYILMQEDVVLDCNNACCELLQITKENIIGRNPGTFSPEYQPNGRKSEELAKEYIEAAYQQGKNNFEWVHKRSNGEEFWAEVYLNVLRQNGKDALFATWRDITQRKLFEETVKASEANFRAFFDSMQDMIVVGTPDGRVLYANDAIINTLGYSLEELDKLGVLGVHPADKQSEAEDIFAAMFRGERNFCPLPVQSKSGKLIPVETRVSFGKWNGEDSIFGILKDLSKEQEALQKFDKLFDVNPAMMALSRLPERKFVEVNRAFLTKLGLTRADVIGKSAMELGLFADADTIQAADAKLNRDGIINNLELKVRTRNGEFRDGLFSGEIVEVQGVKYLLTVMIDITERKRAEEMLRYEKELFTAGPVFTIEWVPSDTWPVRTVSSNVEQILGYSPSEMTAADFKYAELLHPDDIERVLYEVKQYLSQGVDVYEQSYRMKTKGGDYRWFYDFTMIVRDTDGDVIGIRGYMYDQTLQKLVEQEIINERKRLAGIIEGTHVGTWEWNVQTGETIFNERWAEIIGYCLAELHPISNNTWVAHAYPDDLLESGKLLEKHFSGELDYYEFESRMLHKNGDWVWVLDRGRVTSWTDDGKPLIMLGTHQDITARKRAEEATQESTMRLALATKAANVGVWDYDIVSDHLVWDEQMYNLYGITADTFSGAYESWRAGLHPDDLDSADREIKLAINGERDFNTEFRVMWPDGSIHHIRAMAMVIKDDSGQAIRMIGTNWDISEQKRNVEALHKFAQDIEWKNWMLEQEIDNRKETERLLKAAVQEAQRANQAKSEFLANMSHEIRTPMNSILGFSEVMLNYTEDPKSRNYLKTILSSGRTLLSLINDILDLSKIEAGKLDIHTEPANIQNILREVKQIFEQKASEKSLNLILEIEPNFPSEITIDELRLRQILLNLVGNAIKFTHSGYVKIKLYTIQRENITIDFAISIEDTGIGIAKQDRERIFEAFTQQSGNNARAYGGTGLGLAITSRLCKLMNAEIQLESQLNSGSTFTVILRGVNYSIQHSPAEAFTTDNIDIVFVGAKVLIVDDVPFNLDLVVSFLEDYNLELLTAEDGFKAIELAKSELPDLIFMDIRMPGISGYEATERLKTSAETKHIPIVALTASTMHSEIERINSLFDGYLQKPVQKNSVLSELCKFIEHTKIESVSTEDNQDDTTKAISQEIINDFRIAFSDEIFSLMDVMMLDEIQEFADAFEIFAAKYDNTMLKAIAKRFSSAVSAFDIEMIIQELKYLAQIIKE